MPNKTYTLWIQKYNCTVKIACDTKRNAITAIKFKLGLTWMDEVKCIGSNL